MLRIECRNRKGDEVTDVILDLLLPDRAEENSYIDLMCGDGKWLLKKAGLEAKGIVFVDIMKDGLPRPGPYDYKSYALDVLSDHPVFKPAGYDVAVCLDGIEHISKVRGRMLLRRMEMMAPTCILFTPFRLGAELDSAESVDPGSHKSEWEPEDVPHYASIVLPDYHKPAWSGGAFWFWRCDNLEEHFEMVASHLERLGWGSRGG